MREGRADYNRDGVDVVDDLAAEELMQYEIRRVLAHPNTPYWTQTVLTAVAEHVKTYHLVHLRAEVRLLIRIMEGRNARLITEWAKDDVIPTWMRHALAMYLAADGRLARAHVMADAGTLEEILTDWCGFK